MMENLIEDWVINNLIKHGNCSLNPKKAKKYDEDDILDYLKSRGLSCRIKSYEKKFYELNRNMKLEEMNEEFFIIKVANK